MAVSQGNSERGWQNPAFRRGLVIALAAAIAAAVATRGSRNTNGNPVPKAPVSFNEEATPAEELQQRLERQLGDIMTAVFGTPLHELAPDTIRQMEQLMQPYPGAVLNQKESNYENTEAGGALYRLIYDVPDTPEQVKAWLEKEWAPDYLTVRESVSGLKGYTVEIRVPGAKIERDLLIVSIPDAVTGEAKTQVWVMIRNTLQGQSAT